MKSGLVIAAGGSSRRFGGNKLFEMLLGKPVFLHSLERLSPFVDETVLVVPESEKAHFADELAKHGLLERVRVVVGGSDRGASVLNGVLALRDDVEVVAVQDAARPYTSVDLLQRCLASAMEHGSGVAAHRVTDTIKVATPEGIVIDTPDRSTLWAAETPQAFLRQLLIEGYRKCSDAGAAITDDAQAVQALGVDVRLVENTENNMKITYRKDLNSGS